MVGAKGEGVKGIHLPRARGEDECYRESPHPRHTSYGAEKLSRPRPSRGGGLCYVVLHYKTLMGVGCLKIV